MIYVKVNDILYPAYINGRISDKDWDGRESKSITLDSGFDMVNALFLDGTAWNIVEEETVLIIDATGNPVLDEDGAQTFETRQTVFDNRDFSIRGDLTVHVDGTCTVKMGKPTDLEEAYELLYGGEGL